jgi:hypothetical protein
LASSGEPVARRPKVSIVITRKDGSQPGSESTLIKSINTNAVLGFFAAAGVVALILLAVQLHADYAVSFQSPIEISFHSPLVIARRVKSTAAIKARADQRGHSLNSYQQYTCEKFGPACRVALAVQRAENPEGKCEVYHHNTDGTLDWGYFQINTVHLQRPGINLRDLLDCKANIDFAYQLYAENHGFSPWAAFNNGKYVRFLRR